MHVSFRSGGAGGAGRVLAWATLAGGLLTAAPAAFAQSGENFQPPPPQLKAVADVVQGRAGETIDIDVLANDVLTARPPEIQIEISQPPAQGVARLAGNRVQYKSNENALDKDQFSYRITDPGNRTSIATVTVNLRPNVVVVNDEPRLARAPQYTVAVLDNDTIPDNLPVRVTVEARPTSGRATVSPDGRHIVYVPADEEATRDSFRYAVVDARNGQSYGSAQVSIVIPPRPQLVARDDQLRIAYGASGQIDLAANDTVRGRGDLRAVIVSGPAGMATVQQTTLTVTPPRDEPGPVSFQYVLESGDLRSNPATVAVHIDLGLRLEAKSIQLEPNETRDVDVLSGVAIPDELYPGKLRLVIPRRPPAGTAVVPDGRTVRYKAGPERADEVRIPYALVTENGAEPVAENVIIATVRERLPAPDCANTGVPGGMFLVREGVHRVPDDDWFRWLAKAFNVTNSVEVDKPFCIARREVREREMQDFVQSAASAVDRSQWQQIPSAVIFDETAKESVPLANGMTQPFAQAYADWLSTREQGGVLRLPSPVQWLAAAIVAATDERLRIDRNVLATFKAGAREWSRQPCNPPGTSSAKFMALGQSTTVRGEWADARICRPAELFSVEIGIRLVKEVAGSGQLQPRGQR